MRAMRIYRRTAAGTRAWDAQDTQVPLEYRRVLGVLAREAGPAEVCAKLGGSEAALAEILEELEERGLVSATDATPDDTDLDFTSTLSVAALQAAKKPS
jgi:hypothetical protein